MIPIIEDKDLCSGLFGGSDLSEAAINRARKIYANEENVDFIVDHILNTKFNDNEFDYIFDRGCFHVLSPAHR
jgi:ubiquinone/menaquinone biosynthesis C-methylase UbiE